MDPLGEDGYYLQACAWVRLQDYPSAYISLKQLMIQVEQPSDNALRLSICVATKLDPPMYLEALNYCTMLVKDNPRDFDAVRVLTAKE